MIRAPLAAGLRHTACGKRCVCLRLHSPMLFRCKAEDCARVAAWTPSSSAGCPAMRSYHRGPIRVLRGSIKLQGSRGQPLVAEAALGHCARSALARLANLNQSPTPGSHNLACRRPCLCAHRLDAVGPRPIGLKKPKSDINQLLWSAMPQSYMLMRDAHEGAGRPSRVPAPGYLCARDNKYSNYTATL